MTPYLTYIIIGVTALVSYKAFQDAGLKWKLIFNAYQIKERKEWYRFFSHGLIHGDWVHFGFKLGSDWAIFVASWRILDPSYVSWLRCWVSLRGLGAG